MLEYFPAATDKQAFTPDVLQLATRGVQTDGLSFAQRAAAHYTAMLQNRTFKKSNSQNGSWFCLCIYDALIACNVTPERVNFNKRASLAHNDDIDLLIEPSLPRHKRMCLYLKSSLRERWKQVDRDARIAKENFGKSIMTVCLCYAEDGAEGFLKDCTDDKARERLNKKLARREEWALGVDVYAALSQTARVNALIPLLV